MTLYLLLFGWLLGLMAAPFALTLGYEMEQAVRQWRVERRQATELARIRALGLTPWHEGASLSTTELNMSFQERR